MKNKKVQGAEECSDDGINFKSKLERTVYHLLKDANLNPQYEVKKIVLQPAFTPSIPFYTKATKRLKKKSNSNFCQNSYAVRMITYSPDFIVKGKHTTYYIEAKGLKTDRYQLTVRLFRKWLELYDQDSMFFEVYTQSDVKTTINIIKNAESERNSTTD